MEEGPTFIVGLGKRALGLNSMGSFHLLAGGPRVSSMPSLGLGFLACETGGGEVRYEGSSTALGTQ